MVEVRCPTCGKVYHLAEGMIGRKAQCKQCGAIFVVPESPPRPKPAPQTEPAEAEPVEPAPAEPPPEPPAAEERDRPARRSTRPLVSAAGALGPANILLAVGLLLAIGARGCDSIGERGVDRAQARLQSAKTDLSREIEAAVASKDIPRRIYEAKKELAELDPDDADAAGRKAELQKELQELDEERKEVRSGFSARRAKLRDGEWKDRERAVRDSRVGNDYWGYWRECAFVVGSALLVVGCLLVGWKGTGAERIVCLVIVAIVVFSLYVGGLAWLGSVGATVT